jgi:hypothetical protein
LTTDQLTWQPEPGELVGVGVGVGAGVVGAGVGVVGVGAGVVGVGVGVGVGWPPLALVRTTTDSAGTETEPPEKLDETIDGLAAS